MVIPPVWLETARLALRRFTSEDADWFCAFYSVAAQAQYMGGVQERVEAEQLFRERILDYYAAHPGLGSWLVLDRATARPVGFSLLNNVRGQTDIQVGYGFVESAWGKGYATEVTLALVHYGFVDLGIPTIVGITSPPNIASQRVLVKAGLHCEGERVLPDPFYAKHGTMVWFERDRDAWLAERGE